MWCAEQLGSSKQWTIIGIGTHTGTVPTTLQDQTAHVTNQISRGKLLHCQMSDFAVNGWLPVWCQMIETIKGSQGPEQWRLCLFLVRTILEGKRTSNSMNQNEAWRRRKRKPVEISDRFDNCCSGQYQTYWIYKTFHHDTNAKFITSLCGTGTIPTIREKRNTANQCYRVTRCAVAAAVAVE